MARGIRDNRPLPGAAAQARDDRAWARAQLTSASLEELASQYAADTRPRSRDRIVAEVRRRGTTNDAWQAAFTPRTAGPASQSGTGNS